ncbi:MAG: hypothetical protein LBS36_05485 [Oscillospiraceae bacterium]|nr:hypothetical protein [Oscillospiraceae bacterium]
MKHPITKLATAALALSLLLGGCGKQPSGGTSEPQGETGVSETSTVPEGHETDHSFSLSDGRVVYVPSLWVRYDGKKSSVTLNRAVWKSAASGDETVLVQGYEPLFSAGRLDPIAKTDAFSEMELDFAQEPKSIVIHRWNDEYINKNDKSEDFEVITVREKAFAVSGGSLYEITAAFEEATVSYLLYIQ